MHKLKLQYSGHLMQHTDSLEKILMLGKIEGGEGDDRGWDDWIVSPTRWTWVWVSSGSWWWTGKLGVLQSMRLQRVKHNWATELNIKWSFRSSFILGVLVHSNIMKNVLHFCYLTQRGTIFDGIQCIWRQHMPRRVIYCELSGDREGYKL